MRLSISSYCGREIRCRCGRTHFCPIEAVVIREGATDALPSLTEKYRHILLLADENTDAVCGDAVRRLLGERLEACYVFRREGALVPDETAVAEAEAALTPATDLILGVGSGVINDVCKYVSFAHGIGCAIIGTAPSMDGYASSGAAMILGGMKVTKTTHPPRFIVGDVDVLRRAPLEMIRAGYGDIVGKYSSLCDWRLSHLLLGEPYCAEIAALVRGVTDAVRASAARIVAREPAAIGDLMEALVLSGIALSLNGSTRPGSGSEHHLSHFFEITGLVHGEPHFCHGIDVGYAAVVTAGLRERIRALPAPVFCEESEAARHAGWTRVFGPVAPEVEALQREAGWYARDWRPLYREKWPDIVAVLSDCPGEAESARMIGDAGFVMDDFTALYGETKIRDAVRYGKDLKNRYSVLWLAYALFSGERENEETK